MCAFSVFENGAKTQECPFFAAAEWVVRRNSNFHASAVDDTSWSPPVHTPASIHLRISIMKGISPAIIPVQSGETAGGPTAHAEQQLLCLHDRRLLRGSATHRALSVGVMGKGDSTIPVALSFI